MSTCPKYLAFFSFIYFHLGLHSVWDVLHILIILYLHVFFNDNSTNKVFRYSRYQVIKLTWNNDIFCNRITQTLKICENARKWGTKCYLKTKAEEKSKAEVSFGEYWPRNHLPRVAISSCPFGICFKYNFVFWLLWIKYMTCVLILLWRLFIELEIRSKRIM